MDHSESNRAPAERTIPQLDDLQALEILQGGSQRPTLPIKAPSSEHLESCALATEQDLKNTARDKTEEDKPQRIRHVPSPRQSARSHGKIDCRHDAKPPGLWRLRG